jgi:CDP-diacylglycerol pyrophosphatase
MSIGAFRAIDAITLQVMATLETYERDAAELAQRWLDMDLYQAVSEEIDEIQRFSVAIPGVSVAAAALLIAHSELVYTLWRSDEPERVLDEHQAAIESLRRACMRRAMRGLS